MKHTELYPYQKRGVRDLHEYFDGRALLADEQGLGKTLQALYYAWKYLPEDPPGPIVIVVPATGKTNWKRQAAEHLGLRVTVLSHQKVPDHYLAGGLVEPQNEIFVINYDILDQPRRKGEDRDIRRSWWKFLRDLNPRLIIADEGHNLKNVSALRTKAFRKMCKGVRRVIIATGTPLTNRPYELYPLLNILRPDLFSSRFAFAWEYCEPVKKPWGWEFKGAKNLDKLHDILLDTCMIRRLKRDVFDQLPEITWAVNLIELSKKDKEEYDEAVEDFIKWLTKISPELARRAAKAEEMSRLGYLRRLVGRLKVPHVAAWAEDFLQETDERLLLFAQHHAVTGPLMDHFGDAAVLVNGEVTGADRDRAFDRINDLKNRVRLGVLNIDAGGVVWSCRTASNVAFPELPWTPGQLSQAAARVHGVGRGVPGSPAFAHLMVARGTIDEKMCKILQSKQAVLDQTLDGGVAENGLEVYDQLKQELLRTHTRQGVKA